MYTFIMNYIVMVPCLLTENFLFLQKFRLKWMCESGVILMNIYITIICESVGRLEKENSTLFVILTVFSYHLYIVWENKMTMRSSVRVIFRASMCVIEWVAPQFYVYYYDYIELSTKLNNGTFMIRKTIFPKVKLIK